MTNNSSRNSGSGESATPTAARAGQPPEVRQHPFSVPKAPLALICVGVVLTPAALREHYLGEVGRAVNFVAWGGLFLSLLGMPYRARRLQIKGGPLLAVALMMVLMTVAGSQVRTSNLSLDLWAFILPSLLILYSRGTHASVVLRALLPPWSSFLNFAVSLIAVGGLVDAISNNAASRFFASWYGTASYFGLVADNRLVSFYGHALVSASIVMAAFCSNYLLSIVQGSHMPAPLTLFYVLTMAMTTSKSGFVVLLLAVALTSIHLRRLRVLILVSSGLLLAHTYGLLDTVLDRLSESYESGDVSTGRNTALESLFGSGSSRFGLFMGQVVDNSDTALIAALEYPILRLSFKYGLAFGAVFTFVYFVLPFISLLGRWGKNFWIVWLSFAVSVNSYSGPAVYGDVLLLFALTTAMALAARDTPGLRP